MWTSPSINLSNQQTFDSLTDLLSWLIGVHYSALPRNAELLLSWITAQLDLHHNSFNLIAPALTPEPSVDSWYPPPPKYGKLLSSDGEFITDKSNSESTTLSDDAADDDGYTLVECHRTRHARKKMLSPSTATVIIISAVPRLTVVFVPTCPKDFVSNISPGHLSTILEALVPGSIKEAQVNHQGNVIAVDASNPALVSSLLSTTLLCAVPVLLCLPRGKNTTVGIIQDVERGTDREDVCRIYRRPCYFVSSRG